MINLKYISYLFHRSMLSKIILLNQEKIFKKLSNKFSELFI